MALRVALDILDADNGKAERDLPPRLLAREGVGNEKLISEGIGGGGGKGGMARDMEEEVAVMERDEERVEPVT